MAYHYGQTRIQHREGCWTNVIQRTEVMQIGREDVWFMCWALDQGWAFVREISTRWYYIKVYHKYPGRKCTHYRTRLANNWWAYKCVMPLREPMSIVGILNFSILATDWKLRELYDISSIKKKHTYKRNISTEDMMRLFLSYLILSTASTTGRSAIRLIWVLDSRFMQALRRLVIIL